MLDKQKFFQEYILHTEDDLAKNNIEWPELEAIYADYLTIQQELLSAGNYIAERLRNIDKVHSLKFRVKDPEHLIEKIIRKRKKDNSRVINLSNYKTEFTDLIGIRALHLFKEDWLDIHNEIKSIWDLKGNPVANIREGDSQKLRDSFTENGCDVEEHPAGYRSIHYLVETKPSKSLYIAEIQIRTIFEEAWSEIDHKIRYPYNLNNRLLSQFLEIFNRLAGSADEMGSFIRVLEKELTLNEEAYNVIKEERDSLSNKLQEQIEQLKIAEDEKSKLKQTAKSLSDLDKGEFVISTDNDNSDLSSVSIAGLTALMLARFNPKNRESNLSLLREYMTNPTSFSTKINQGKIFIEEDVQGSNEDINSKDNKEDDGKE